MHYRMSTGAMSTHYKMINYTLLAVSTRPPAGVVSASTVLALPASVRSFISIRQVAPNDTDLD